MKIAIDLDEVTAEFLEKLLEYHCLKTDKKISKEEFLSYNFWETWGGTREEAIKIVYDFHKSKMFDGIQPVRGAIKSVEKLLKENEIVIITSRPANQRRKTKAWLKKYFGKIKIEVYFTGDFHKGKNTKIEICKKIGIDLILEDHPDYAQKCAEEEIKVILFDRPWNRNLAAHPSIFRVKNWNQALTQISKL